MTKLSTQPYKGTRDYYPEDKRVQNYIFDVWRRIVETYGYQEYSAPLLESLEVYTAKSGEELAGEQTYTFTDRGDRTVAIRPEMTPSISRMVAARRQDLGYPARLYSIANFMRYERPQRGREREFWQLNADIFGVDTMLADAEIIEMADAMMKAFGADESMYVIRINHRALIDQIMHEYLGLDNDRSHKLIKLLDRKAKMPAEDFVAAAREVLGNDELVVKLETLTTLQSIAELPEELQASRGALELKELFDWFDKADMTNVIFDISLMRGFDYYTGMVFEMFDLHPDNNRSMFGGGRYDGLVGLFGVEPVATVGFAPGLTTTELFLRSHNLLPELHSSTDIGIVIADDSLAAALDVARQLRREGLAVAVDITGRKLDKQLKAAVKNGIRTLVFIGSQEVSENRYTVKDMITGDEQKLVVSDIVALAKIRHNT
tara:strand:- start:2039 stop:3337 length:1299 start_codon:yes stop_codon:yes gene_type:complete